MGTTNSPAVACRLDNSGLRKMETTKSIFQGVPMENTRRRNLAERTYKLDVGHGRVLMDDNGAPSALVFSMVDDFLVHAPHPRAIWPSVFCVHGSQCAVRIHLPTHQDEPSGPDSEVLRNAL
jgi:hypothetical protein